MYGFDPAQQEYGPTVVPSVVKYILPPFGVQCSVLHGIFVHMVPPTPHTEFENADIESSTVLHASRRVFQVGSDNFSGVKQ
jgi:hypothetical protein